MPTERSSASKEGRPARWLLPACTGLSILLGWQLLVGAGWVDAKLLPLPGAIIERGWELRRDILPAAGRTFLAAALGFAAAVGGGFLVALALGSARWIKQAFYPWIFALQMTPVIMLVPIIAFWFGFGIPGIIVIAFLLGFFPVVANTTLGFISVDPRYVDLFRLNRAGTFQELRLLRIPHALPYFLAGARIAATLAPIGAIVGDLFLGTSRWAGLGYLMLVYRGRAETEGVFALAGAACLLGFIFVGLVYWVNWLLLRNWHPSALERE